MPKGIHTYHFGRLNLLGIYPDDKREYLYEAMKAGVIFEHKRFKYVLVGVRDMQFANSTYGYGRLVKYKTLLEGELVDEDAKELIEGGLERGVVAKSDYFLHYQTSMIAYRPINGRISDRQFRFTFCELIENGKDNMFIQARIESIDEEVKIREFIESLDVVERISISIHPSNPSNRDVWERLDERLRNLNAARLRQIVDAGEGGLDKHALENDDAYKGVMMAADGYGTGSVKGKRNGRSVVLNTGDSPVTKDISEDQDDPQGVLAQLQTTFEQLKRRLKP